MIEKEITIYDIASKLNISPSTVSRGLKNHPNIKQETKDKIYEVAREMDYRINQFASKLKLQHTQTLGVIVPKIDSYFMSTALAGIETVANRNGYNLLICQSQESSLKEKNNADLMFSNRVDGLLVSLAFDTADTRHFESFFNRNIPVVFFDRVPDDSKITNILIDNYRAAYQATTHLIEQGFKKIVHITAPSKSRVYMDRLNGYKQALAHSNLTFDQDNVLVGNLSYDDGIRAAELIKSMEEPPDAVFAANDFCAIGCMQHLMSLGYEVPKDIAFIGFNNDPASIVVKPTLSTVNYPGFQMGEIAALNILNHLDGVLNLQTTNQIVLKHEIIVRASSKRLS